MQRKLLHIALTAFCLLLFLSLAGCEDETGSLFPVPAVIFPETNPIYYPNQVVPIKWDVPADAEMVEIQLLITTDSLLTYKGELPFLQADISGYYPQRGIDHTFDASLKEFLYCGFRVRQRVGLGAGSWTKIYYFRVHPLSTLQIKQINVVADFDFVTQQSDNYYSGITRSLKKLNIDSLMITKGVAPTRIRLVKPVSGFIENHGNNADDFQRTSIGFKETVQGFFPFDILGETQGGAQKANLQYYPFGGLYRNLYEDMGGKSINMFLAYFLASNKNAGRQHRLSVNLTLDCYYK